MEFSLEGNKSLEQWRVEGPNLPSHPYSLGFKYISSPACDHY